MVSSIAIFGIIALPYYMFVNNGFILNIIFPLFSVVFISFLSNITSYFLESKQKDLIKGKFASKVSPEVMEDLLKKGNTGDILEGTEREVTVFFSDVRGFTNISEAMPSAKHLIEFLNQYMNPMVDIIVKEKGTIDKFIGDAIMAYWNAPNDVANHQDRAVTASINQIKALVPLNAQLKLENKPLIDIGIGLNTGIATVGEMGSAGRSDYTVIGDPINLGARLESLCKSYGAKIIISQFTKNALKKEYVIRDLDLVRVKGKTEPVEIFEVLDFNQAEGRIKDELDSYHKALYLYRGGNFKEALAIFEDINSWEDKRNKNIYNIYIERCRHYIEEPPVNFDGVFTHTTKG
jgi:adenylate cyclase